MIYLFVGALSPEKDQAISQLKSKLFPNGDALRFDFDLIDGQRVEASSLKQSLIALPALSKRRLVLVRSAHKLSTQNKDLIAEFSQGKNDHADLIIDWENDEAPSGFVKSLGASVKVSEFGGVKKYNVFDVTRNIPYQPAEALKILNVLFESGQHPLQILGGLLWFWGKAKPQLSKESFTQGLKELQEADLNIKRSKLRPEQAIEVLLLKLCWLYSR